MTQRKIAATVLAQLLGGWTGRGPAYLNLAHSLQHLILDGRLPLAAYLPSERTLAEALGLSRNTIKASYNVLQDEGFLYLRPGVRGVIRLPAGASTPGVPLPPLTHPHLLDFASAALPAPEGLIHEAYTHALTALPTYLPTHGYLPLGLPALRSAVAARYAARGLPTTAEQVVITFGAQHALSLIVRVFTSPGDRVLVDQPTYPHALDALRGASCRIVPVALTPEGWDPDAWAAAARQTSPRLAYLIPDFHNPTGHLMPDAVRTQITRLCRETRTLLVVDETLTDLALDVPVPSPFAGNDRYDTVVSIGSMSKSFWGGLRLGWIRAPRDVAERLGAARSSVDLGTPVVEQLAGAWLLQDPGPFLERRQQQLREQREVLTEQLNLQLPEWIYRLPEGGLSLWVTLPQPIGPALVAQATRFGLRLTAGERFAHDGLLARQLRLPFTRPAAELHEGVTRLATLYRELVSDDSRRNDPRVNVQLDMY
ncbi:PLP-dependent aminotransferase family protein [Deinococcus sp. QL22]|uniref:MocR-like transcription factor YczR n=1 Tax=Deinococcus sp. QL22 TaxID=2939437 RepID=UPI002016BFD5|nr:PLP-dependent aminotransferase family protein [Deinococcus sp. QL22]UQN09008.1 PLP-dependent aminotransferase family protein [Deinococcus sp. QL22]